MIDNNNNTSMFGPRNKSYWILEWNFITGIMMKYFVCYVQ